MKKKTSEITIKPELYPRDRINDSKVEEYTHYIGVLPAIIINQDNILIDGAHRLHAYMKAEQEEIECSVIKTKDDDDLFLKAVELNAKHGYQMSQSEKKKHVVKLYEKTLKNEAKTFDVKRIKDTFSIPESTFSDWVKNLNEELESQILKNILDLYLQNKTQEEIAIIIYGDEKKQKIVSSKIDEITTFFKLLEDMPKSDEPLKYKEIARNWCVLAKWKIIPEKDENLPQKFKWLYDDYVKNDGVFKFKQQLYNIWNQQSYDSDNTHFGKFPFSFMENLIYYYTKPFDVVFDPFAGGGTTIDVCNKWLRKYYASDLNPIATRRDIMKWDIANGLPKDIPSKVDFVFLDPPYWRQAKDKYSKDKEDMGNMDLNKFYMGIENIARELKKKMKTGHVGFVISPTQWPNDDHKFEDHIITIINIFGKYGFKEKMRYVLPYSTELYNGTQVNIAKDEKIPMNIVRDLVVFEK